ncbi:hypothetical protein AB0G02_18330 [Actinosynnema sp. NPDC023658]|uniref:hypothetical protein n=1 Tax=Actinosynnema sp. NPDC023658 TaxID=3155465 RepID=UPI0033E2D60B
MAEPVRARRLTEDEGRRLLNYVRRGKQGTIRMRRAMIILASSSGTPAPSIARLVAADPDTVRDRPVSPRSAHPAAPVEVPRVDTRPRGKCVSHYNHRRPHQALQLTPPRPDRPIAQPDTSIRRRPVLDGLINEYEPTAA